MDFSCFSAGLPAEPGPTSILWSLEKTSKETHETVKSMVLATTPEPSIPGDISCGLYTIGEAYQVWIELKTVADLHIFLSLYSLRSIRRETQVAAKSPLLSLLLLISAWISNTTRPL